MRLTHGSLFSGIGGFDLAAHWAGIPTLWQVEKDPYCRAVLRKHFPEAKQYDEIKGLTGIEPVDIISGGFPCQPFSVAGKHRGKEDDRFLWPEMLRIIAEVRPTYVVAENVAGIIPVELDSVLASLEAEAYTVWPLVIPACAVNAPHRRNRVWVVAYSNTKGLQGTWQGQDQEWKATDGQCGPSGSSPSNDTWWAIEPDVGRVAHGVSARVDRLKSLGNAIVPQVAYEIFKAIKDIECVL